MKGLHDRLLPVAAIAAIACTPQRPQLDAPAPVVQASVDLPAVKPVASAVPPSADIAIESCSYAGDGTLVVQGGGVLLARALDGTTKAVKLASKQSGIVSETLPGVVLQTAGGRPVALLATPGLESLYEGAGTALLGGGVIVLDAPRALLVEHAGKLVRMAAPLAPPEVNVDRVALVDFGTRLDVTTMGAPDVPPAGWLYDAVSGQKLGRGLVMPSVGMTPKYGVPLGHVGFQVEEGDVLRVDLDTAQVIRRAHPACGTPKELADFGPGSGLGNPTPDPGGRTLVVTCFKDLIALDAVTLRELHRTKDVVPGCDQWPMLDGTMLDDARTLVLRGCGGEARMDVKTGVYACGDDDGILGGPYDMFPPSPAGPGRPPAQVSRRPAGREHLPRCHPENASLPAPIGTSGLYQSTYDVPPAVLTPAGKIVLEDPSMVAGVAPDESQFAYVHGTHVVVRKLPQGEVVADFPLTAP